MVLLTINYTTFKKYVRLKYSVLIVLAIVMVFVIPYSINDTSWVPQRSIENIEELGHSKLKEIAQQHYKIDKFTQKYQFAENILDNKLLVINAPDFSYSSLEIDNLFQFISRGGHLLILGTTSSTINLLRNFGYNVVNNRIFDRDNNFGETGLIEIYYGDSVYMGVTPSKIQYTTFDGIEEINILVLTSEEATDEFSIRENLDRKGVMTVGVIESESTNEVYSEISILTDNWFLSNKYLEINPDNVNLFLEIVKDISTEITNIIFDESHYDYLPVNRIGVENIFGRYINSTGFILVLFFISVIIPLLFASKNGLFTDLAIVFNDERLSKKIGRRLETLHLKNVPAVPLTLEERFLVENKLEMHIRGIFYFQYIASELLNYISLNNLEDLMDSSIIKDLNYMKDLVIIEVECWKLIKLTNQSILSAMKIKLDINLLN